MKKLFLLIFIPFISFGQCEDGESSIVFSTTTGEWAYEMAWGLWDYDTWMAGNPSPDNAIVAFQGTDNYETTSVQACVPSTGCYMIAAYDSYGDGWNGGSLLVNINDSKSPQSYEMSDGTWAYWNFELEIKSCNWEIPGCTNPEAANYNSLATIDNGSCIVPEFFEWDKQQREYFLYIPDNLPEDAPLVFVLHGYWGEGSDMLGLFEEQANNFEFAVCYPTGLEDNYGTNHWNSNFNEIMTSVDDLGFLSNLAIKLQQDYNLSPEKTFACGMSNGGYMSWSLACNAPETFKGIASVTGTMSGPDWQTCNPSILVPVMQISGTSDDVVPMDGSMGYLDEGWGGAPDIYTVMNYWGDLHGCSENETTNWQFDYSTDLTSYFSCDYNTSTELRLYVSDGMGHTWPSYAEDQIWEFFMQIAANPLNVKENFGAEKVLLKTTDLLGRTGYKKGFQINIFENGTVEKTYIIN